MLGDSRSGSGGFCGSRAALRGHGKNRSESGVGGRKNYPRPGRRSTVVTAVDTRATNLPEGAEKSSILTRDPCAQKSRKGEEAKTAFSGQGTSPPKPTRGSERNECEARRAR